MPVVVCYGDSNTYGFDVETGGRFAKSVRWTGVLAAELRDEADVIEEGLNGRTTIWDDPFLDGRNGRTYLLPCLRSHAPIDVVVLMLGTNDTKTIFGRSAAEITSGVEALVLQVLGSDSGPDGRAPKVLLVAPVAPAEATERSEIWGFGEARATGLQMTRLYRTLAGLRNVAFLDAGEHAVVDPVDGVHLSPGGHAALGRAVAVAVRHLL